MLEAAGLPASEENIFIAATCKEKGIAYLKGEAVVNVRKKSPQTAKQDGEKGYTVTIGGRPYSVLIQGQTAVVDGVPYDFAIEEGLAQPQAVPSQPAASAPSQAAATEAVNAPVPGTIVRIEAKIGQKVSRGDVLVILESMKMETEVRSPANGTVASIAVAQGDQVSAGQALLSLS
jgi:pyruvate carboxylase subunit B